jgi:hypothetical protein
MKISIINNFILEININGRIIIEEPPQDNLPLILNKYLPNFREINEIYLLSGPGSIMAARNLIGYFLGLTNFLYSNKIKVYLIDIIRDWYLKKWPHKKIIYPFTNKKLLMAYEKNNQYYYEFLDKLPNNYKDDEFLLDYSISNFNFDYKGKDLIYWNSNNLLETNVDPNTLNHLVQYKIW